MSINKNEFRQFLPRFLTLISVRGKLPSNFFISLCISSKNVERPCLLRKYRVFVFRYIEAEMKGHNSRRSHLEVFCKKVFLKTSQNSQKNTCGRVSFLRPTTLLKKETLAQVFSRQLWQIFRNNFFIERLRWLLL